MSYYGNTVRLGLIDVPALALGMGVVPLKGVVAGITRSTGVVAPKGVVPGIALFVPRGSLLGNGLTAGLNPGCTPTVPVWVPIVAPAPPLGCCAATNENAATQITAILTCNIFIQ